MIIMPYTTDALMDLVIRITIQVYGHRANVTKRLTPPSILS